MNTTKNFIVIIVISALVGGLATFAAIKIIPKQEKTENELIKEFYLVENAVHVSPHHIRKSIMKGGEASDLILVDLRSEEEYLEEHIVGAINIPAYKDKDHSDYGAIERIKKSFRELKEKNPQKDIIVYCYSIPCMTGRKIGKILAEDGIYVKHLGVGWNEWRYFWKLWNHPHEWDITDPTEYTASGPEPGVFKGRNYLEGEIPEPCPIEGGLGC